MREKSRPKQSSKILMSMSKKSIVRFVDTIISTDPKMNGASKDRIFSPNFKTQNINRIAKAITHFAFRNGPIEGMHSKEQLSQKDMKVLNKFMVDRLAYVFQLIMSERWTEFEFLVESHRFYGTEWDPAKPDDGGLRNIIIEELYQGARGERTLFL